MKPKTIKIGRRTFHQDTPPRDWKDLISRITGLNYCDRGCGCGENNRLWWYPVFNRAGIPEWLPGTMNGIDTGSLWRWLFEHGKVDWRTNGDES